ncbi:MAG: discoidin domain-containing protein [Puniceicoccales bacterium]|jgi:hypothetical protein|nr:discoidin domain-containing protein [Puniceicoccales bacterium]
MKTKSLIALLAALCAGVLPAQAQGETVELKIDTPPYTRISGMSSFSIPPQFFEREPLPHPVIQVPEGTTNLARGRPVTSSDKAPAEGEISYITDGDKDGDEGFDVELAPGVQWVQIDLGKSAELYAVAIWHFHRWRPRAYRSVVVQISNDAGFKKDVTTVFNNDYENKAGLGIGRDKVYIETNRGKLIPVNAVKGRYVRLYSAGNTVNGANHYVEVEVFGKP